MDVANHRVESPNARVRPISSRSSSLGQQPCAPPSHLDHARSMRRATSPATTVGSGHRGLGPLAHTSRSRPLARCTASALRKTADYITPVLRYIAAHFVGALSIHDRRGRAAAHVHRDGGRRLEEHVTSHHITSHHRGNRSHRRAVASGRCRGSWPAPSAYEPSLPGTCASSGGTSCLPCASCVGRQRAQDPQLVPRVGRYRAC